MLNNKYSRTGLDIPHTQTHTYIKSYMHTYIHAYIHTYIYTYIRIHTYIPRSSAIIFRFIIPHVKILDSGWSRAMD